MADLDPDVQREIENLGHYVNGLLDAGQTPAQVVGAYRGELKMDKQALFPILSIPEISYPEYLIEDLKSMSSRLVESLKNNPIDLDSGYLPFDLRELEFPSNVNFSMFEWMMIS